MPNEISGIGQRMRSLRQARGWPQAKAAAVLNIADRTYKFYELERREIPLSVALAFCREFSVELKWLVTGEGPQGATSGETLYQAVNRATLQALADKIGLSDPEKLAEQIDYVYSQCLTKGSDPTEEATALARIIS